ncbi:MAG: quinone oxidoreductase [Candidatus Lambdaproteobacteria bacterium]|nr:quinone oxidoreductase [Candidatus Lambdaproteobacteria bacterium]
MKAMRIHAFGGPEQIRCDEVPVPRPGPGQLLLKMAAIGVNYKDTHVRAGGYDVPLPFTLGREGAGVVEAIGPGVTGFALGDRVAFAPEIGAYAEYNLLDAQRAVPLPQGIDFASAAAAMLQGMSAHFLVHDTWPVQAGQRVLIHAGAGGVGLLLIQLCKAKGATVLTTVSTDEKEAVARAAGADHVIRYTQVDFEAAAREIVGEAGIDVIYDAVGLTTFEKGLRLLRRRGMMVLYGRSSGLPDLNALAWQGSHYLCQPILGDHIVTREALLARASAVLRMVADDRLKLRIGRVYPLTEAARAHADLNGRATTGKLLLQP